MKFGIDRLLSDPQLRKPLHGKRVALVAHPASVTHHLTHSLDALASLGEIKLSAAFGPQHGMRGDKQDNMMESPDFNDSFCMRWPSFGPLVRSDNEVSHSSRDSCFEVRSKLRAKLLRKGRSPASCPLSRSVTMLSAVWCTVWS